MSTISNGCKEVKSVGCFRCLEQDRTKCNKPVNSHPSLNKMTVIYSHIEGDLLILMQLPAEELGRKIILCLAVQSLGSAPRGNMRNVVWRTKTVIKYQQYGNEVTVLNISVIIHNSSEKQHC